MPGARRQVPENSEEVYMKRHTDLISVCLLQALSFRAKRGICFLEQSKSRSLASLGMTASEFLVPGAWRLATVSPDSLPSDF